ncbi:hypothetical protein FEM48_Zijuj03G0122000 [Ziziphus jujuba var. spinosa]|uniref:Replication protein A 70 kDa DNA-binding subunit B-like n=1 Tax=Ziziphus jujuba var. spinosa TaxID=714518 RepID=A0A978VQ86_ZIZJJ|nr:hypothetical protein FEM48_Zijuj03G0122000 [Ziziphus jujuba var. spinosa]
MLLFLFCHTGVTGCGMACIMVMMTYSMVRIELVYFIQNSELHYCTSEKTLPYHRSKANQGYSSSTKRLDSKVVVIEKAMPRVSKSSPNKYQRLFKYLQWTINGRTIVEEVTGDSEIIVPAVYNFVPFSQLHTYIDSLSNVAIEIKPKKEIITNDGLEIVQEMTLMNDNMDTVMLTMWNQFVNNECTQILNIMNRKPIIIGCRLKVAHIMVSRFQPNPPVHLLLNRRYPSSCFIICHGHNMWKDWFETKSLSTLPSAEDIITIKDNINLIRGEAFGSMVTSK